MSDVLYSIRMRASLGGRHISGAERIVGRSALSAASGELIGRAMAHERGRPDSVTLSVDSLAGRYITRLAPLPVTVRDAGSVLDGQAIAVKELVRAGVAQTAALAALRSMGVGASRPGGTMSGAMILDASSGERLEPDMERGIRARSVDYEEGCLKELAETLKARGLDRTHLKEALALATKVAHAPAARAELCISDDPSYVTGYAASAEHGYVRITPMKNAGDPMGGRAFFVDRAAFDLDAYVAYMRENPVLMDGALTFIP